MSARPIPPYSDLSPTIKGPCSPIVVHIMASLCLAAIAGFGSALGTYYGFDKSYIWTVSLSGASGIIAAFTLFIVLRCWYHFTNRSRESGEMQPAGAVEEMLTDPEPDSTSTPAPKPKIPRHGSIESEINKHDDSETRAALFKEYLTQGCEELETRKLTPLSLLYRLAQSLPNIDVSVEQKGELAEAFYGIGLATYWDCGDASILTFLCCEFPLSETSAEMRSLIAKQLAAIDGALIAKTIDRFELPEDEDLIEIATDAFEQNPPVVYELFTRFGISTESIPSVANLASELKLIEQELGITSTHETPQMLLEKLGKILPLAASLNKKSTIPTHISYAVESIVGKLCKESNEKTMIQAVNLINLSPSSLSLPLIQIIYNKLLFLNPELERYCTTQKSIQGGNQTFLTPAGAQFFFHKELELYREELSEEASLDLIDLESLDEKIRQWGRNLSARLGIFVVYLSHNALEKHGIATSSDHYLSCELARNETESFDLLISDSKGDNERFILYVVESLIPLIEEGLLGEIYILGPKRQLDGSNCSLFAIDDAITMAIHPDFFSAVKSETEGESGHSLLFAGDKEIRYHRLSQVPYLLARLNQSNDHLPANSSPAPSTESSFCYSASGKKQNLAAEWGMCLALQVIFESALI